MNLDDLRAAQVDERGTDSLQPLRPTFYEEAAAYLADLRDRRDRLADEVDDPFDSDEIRQLTDELETAEEVVESIYDRRVGKLVKKASLAAADMSTDEDGLTEEERALYTDLVDRIAENRSAVLEALDRGPAGPGEPTPEPEAPADPEPTDGPEEAFDAAEAMGAESPTELEEGTTADVDREPEPDGGSATAPETASDEQPDDRLTVRITAEVGEIYGVDDRVYTLDAEDVVTLPEPNATPLLERGAAQRVD